MKTILVDAIGTLILEDVKGIFPEMYLLLESYSNEKIVLTMADESTMKEFGLDQMTYEVFTTKGNPKKTNKEYYEQLLEHYDLRAEEVIYFEHNLQAVKVAESLGITSYQYDSKKKDLKALKGFLDQNL